MNPIIKFQMVIFDVSGNIALIFELQETEK